MQLPQGMAYGNWDFPEPILRDLTFEIEIFGNVERHPGRYLQLYDGHIADVGSYFGLQTDVFKSGRGGMGHGLIFCRWKSRDPSNSRATPNGWVESAGYEGDFVGVRALVPWSVGQYRCQLLVVDTDSKGVWYEFSLTDHKTDQTYSAGCLRFPASQINSEGGTWTEVYSGANTESEVPETELRVLSMAANGMTLHPTKCRVCYEKFLKSDAYVENGVLFLRSGRDVKRIHEATQYAIDT